MVKTKCKIDKMSMMLLDSFLIQFLMRLIQAGVNRTEIANEIITIWDAIRDLIYLITWALMFYFLSEMIVIMTLLTEQYDDEEEEETPDDVFKSNITKGEAIRTQLRVRN